MARKDEIDRMIILIYHSRNSSGYTNFSRSIDWLDKLPMDGLMEISSLLSHLKADVEHEIGQRKKDGIPRYSREWHESQERTRQEGERLLNDIGINVSRRTPPHDQ